MQYISQVVQRRRIEGLRKHGYPSAERFQAAVLKRF
jgi:hypothetical protein